jgi:alkanesulfonate monooxygenase SsuD/methylene tetrahydromethanopterin reductase-like flavin-dependent oxidoreductase (luciferase family)
LVARRWTTDVQNGAIPKIAYSSYDSPRLCETACGPFIVFEWLKRRNDRAHAANADGRTLIGIFGHLRASEEARRLAAEASQSGYDESAKHWRRVGKSISRLGDRRRWIPGAALWVKAPQNQPPIPGGGHEERNSSQR